MRFESLASCVESEKSLSRAASFSLNQAMSLVVRSAKPLSHRISGTLSSFCEGEPLEAEGGGGGRAEFRDEVLLCVALGSLGIYKTIVKGVFDDEGEGDEFLVGA